jgi:hypothetical protein
MGGRDTGAISDGWWAVYVIRNSTTEAVDALFSLNITTPTLLPAGYDQYRRVGMIYRTGGVIKPFFQWGDEFRWVTPPLDVDATNPGTSGNLRTLTVPLNHMIDAHLRVILIPHSTINTALLISSPNEADLAPSLTASPLATMVADTDGPGVASGADIMVLCINGQIRTRLDQSDASAVIRIATLGWTDPRGETL